MSAEGPPKKNHTWPPGPEGKKVHAHEVLELKPHEVGNVIKIKAAERKLRAKHSVDREGGSEAHVKTIGAAAEEAIARAEGRWDERRGEARPKETLQTLRTAELSEQARLDRERRKSSPDPQIIQQSEGALRAIAARKKVLEQEEARAAEKEDRAHQERIAAIRKEEEEVKAREERERLERVEATRKQEEAGASEQPAETEGTQTEEEPVVTGKAVVPQGEVIDNPTEPPSEGVVVVRESPEEEATEEPGRAVVVAESSFSGDIVPASAETPTQNEAVSLYEEDEYLPAAGGGGGGEGGGGDDDETAPEHPEERGPHTAHAHAHGDHGHGAHDDHSHDDHGHDSHDSGHGEGGHGSHAHGEKKKGLFGAWMSFFGSLFSFPGETVKGFGAFFGKGGGGGGGGGGESHGH